MPKASPKIDLSIIIPVFEPQAFLSDTLQSIGNNDFPKYEICLVWDGHEHPPELHGSYRHILHQTNRGVTASLNSGLIRARGKYIAFLDHDDLLYPGSLQWRYSWLEAFPNEVAIFGIMHEIVDSRGKRIENLTNIIHEKSNNLPDRLSIDYFRQGRWVPMSPLSLGMYRSDWLNEIGPFDEQLTTAHDIDIIYRMLKTTTIAVVQKPVMSHRIHGQNHSTRLVDKDLYPTARQKAERWFVHQQNQIPYA